MRKFNIRWWSTEEFREKRLRDAGEVRGVEIPLSCGQIFTATEGPEEMPPFWGWLQAIRESDGKAAFGF